MWSEPVEGSRWEPVARRFDDERRPEPAYAPEPPRPLHDRVLAWLDGLVGGRPALEELDEVPLRPAERPSCAEPEELEAYDAVAGLLDRVTERFFDEEASHAFRHGLNALWNVASEQITSPRSPAHTAAGVCWMIGRANGLFDAGGPVRQKDVARELWLKGNLSAPGRRFATAVRDVWVDQATRPYEFPDLFCLARPDLLTSTTRRQLVRWRDRALTAREAHRAEVLPSEVES
jgi:hypothetical protein